MASPFKQIFTDVLLKKFYPDGSFLKELTSFDHMVDNNTINLSECGADPEVVENNATWPLTPAQRTDSGIAIPLATFDTKPTHVPNVEEMETSYDKVASVTAQHVSALNAKASKSAIFNIAPAKNSAKTPVLETSGENRGDGKKRLTFADVLKLRTAFNKADLPQEGRVLVLTPDHEADLMLEDANRYNAMMTSGKVAGFKVYTFSSNPTYTSVNAKKAYGATDGLQASIAFLGSECMRAMGDIEGEPEARWAEYRGWVFGAQLRFVAQPLRGMGIGAIIDKVAE